MPNEKLRKVSHIGLWVSMAVVAVFIWILWAATHSKTENNRYGSGTIPVNIEDRNYGLINLKPCGALFSFRTDKLDKPEVKKN